MGGIHRKEGEITEDILRHTQREKDATFELKTQNMGGKGKRVREDDGGYRGKQVTLGSIRNVHTKQMNA